MFIEEDTALGNLATWHGTMAPALGTENNFCLDSNCVFLILGS